MSREIFSVTSDQAEEFAKQFEFALKATADAIGEQGNTLVVLGESVQSLVRIVRSFEARITALEAK